MRGVGGVVWEVAVQDVGQDHGRGTVAYKYELEMYSIADVIGSRLRHTDYNGVNVNVNVNVDVDVDVRAD